MHGIVPAAGEGTRLGALTDDRPKPLVEVAGRPLIEYGLDALVDLGVEGIVVVIGYRGGAIVDHVGGAYRDTPVTYVHQPERRGLGDAVHRARAAVSGPVVVHNADNIIDADLTRVVEARCDGADGAILVESADRERAATTGVVEVDDGRVTGVVEKPDDPPSTLITTGCYVLPAAVGHACALVQPGPTGEVELTAAVDLLARAGYEIVPIEADSWRVNVNTPRDIERATSRLASR